jgi:hypothetical protein
MNKKMILMTFVSLAFSMNASAAMDKLAAREVLNKDYHSQVEVLKKFKEDYDKSGGKWEKMTAAQKSAFGTAISVLSDKLPGIKASHLQIIFLRKADILEDVVRLDNALTKGNAEEQKKASVQIELIKNVAENIDAENFNTLEAKAATKLLQLDLLSLPVKATNVVEAVNANLNSSKTKGGQALMKAIQEGTKGIKLEDLINCV